MLHNVNDSGQETGQEVLQEAPDLVSELSRAPQGRSGLLSVVLEDHSSTSQLVHQHFLTDSECSLFKVLPCDTPRTHAYECHPCQDWPHAKRYSSCWGSRHKGRV